jgi:hypothetical protein
VFVLVSAVTVAFAHEHRTIAGKYDVVVGWNTEPAFANQTNGALIIVYKAGTKDPVEGVEKTLKVDVAAGGGAPKTFELRADDDRPGYYIADLIPTRTGSYIFTFKGKIESTDVNEVFESGPNRFDDVADNSALQVPQASGSNQIAALQSDLNTARMLGGAGLVAGILGIAVGALALRRK